MLLFEMTNIAREIGVLCIDFVASGLASDKKVHKTSKDYCIIYCPMLQSVDGYVKTTFY